MDNRNKNMTTGNLVISWGIAGLVGLIAFLLFLIVGEQTWTTSGFGGALIAIVLVVIFTIIFGRELPPLGSVAGPTVTSSSPSPAKSAAAPVPAAAASTQAAAPVAPEIAAGSAGGGGGGAAATSPAATGTPAGEGAAQAAERKQDEMAAKAAAAKSTDAGAEADAEADAPAGAGTKPVTLDGPRGGAADDLKKIKGVGPKMEKMCNDLGFWHFDQIASWSPSEVAWVDENLEGFKGRVSRDEWVTQAKALAAGEETEFSKKVDKGGVY